VLHVSVAFVLMLPPSTVPLPACFPAHVIDGAADVVEVDFLLADAVPWFEIPGDAKVTVCVPPLHVVLPPAAKALPLVATCAMPNDRTGTELNTTTDISLRNTYSTPIFS
jgi:hypothetical protein